jgi:hypothetical protein
MLTMQCNKHNIAVRPQLNASMSQSFSDYYGIDEDTFEATGALDPILDVDTRLFIDPALLRTTLIPELERSYEEVTNYFADVVKVIKRIERPLDRMWREADKRLTFPEIGGLSIGYASKGTSGSGMGTKLRAQLLTTARQVVTAGVDDPAMFELVGIFEDGIGSDRISDMIAKIIGRDLVSFTQRVCSDCGIPMESHRIAALGVEEDLPINPLTKLPLILVPRDILRDLPVAEDYSDVRFAAQFNATLREELNSGIGMALREMSTKEKKEKLKESFVRFPEVLAEVIRQYQASVPTQYDFSDDPSGEVIWYKATRKLPIAAPLDLRLSARPSVEEVFKVVEAICMHFKRLVEDNQLGQLLYNKDGKPKHESAAQLLFFGVASAYCQANNLDLSPESDAGRGPVDFKVSAGFTEKVLVELKLTSNKQLSHGFQNQLPIYQAAENATHGIYLVIDNGGASAARLKAFGQMVRDADRKSPKVIMVDAVRKDSASKADE